MTVLCKRLVLITLGFIVAILFIQTAPPTYAQTGGSLNLLGHFGGYTSALFSDGNTAYIGIGGALAIVDVSDPANPTLIGKSGPLPGVIRDIEVVGGVAYMVDWDGLVTVDVSDPAVPTFLGSYDTGAVPQGVQVVGHVAYVANSYNGLMIVDVSDPATPVPLGSYETAGSARAVHVVGRVAYLADDDNGLVTVDVTDPAAPTLLGAYETAGSVRAVHVVGRVAYVADSWNGLVTVDVSDPAAPSFLGSYDIDEVYGSAGVSPPFILPEEIVGRLYLPFITQ